MSNSKPATGAELRRRRSLAKASAKEWRKRNPEKVAAQRARHIKRHPKYTLWKGARDRARKNYLNFTIVEADITIPRFCPWLGIKLARPAGPRKDDSPSLDRIDNVQGYTLGNIEVISWRANRLKGDANLQEIIRMGRRARRLLK